MIQKNIGRGARLAIDSFWLIWEHKKLALLTAFIALVIEFVSNATLIKLNSLIDIGGLRVIGEASSLFIVLFTLSIEYITTLFAGLISIYTYDFLNNRTPSIRAALLIIARHTPAILIFSVLNAVILMDVFLHTITTNTLIITMIRICWFIITFFVIQILVLEDQSLLESFKRSFKLAKSSIFKIVEGSIVIIMLTILIFLPLYFLLSQISLLVLTLFSTGNLVIWITVFATKLYYESRPSN